MNLPPSGGEGRPSSRAATWIAALDAACDAIAVALADLPPAERRRELSRGAGGDISVEVDLLAEQLIVDGLDAVAEQEGGFTVIAEERGEQVVGAGGPPLAVIDPIDGSLNAKRGMPAFSTSVAVADGPDMGDVWLGYVRDLGTGVTYVAERGRGAWTQAGPLRCAAADAPLELIAFEGASPERIARAAAGLAGEVDRLRVVGSLALSLCAVASGACDGMAGLTRARPVDTAAAQLIAQEAGAIVGMPGPEDVEGTSLDLAVRHPIVAARDPEVLEVVRAAVPAASGQRLHVD